MNSSISQGDVLLIAELWKMDRANDPVRINLGLGLKRGSSNALDLFWS